jgi:methylglyoxal synthase
MDELALSALGGTPQRRRVALVAHDNKKRDLVDWVGYNRGTLSGHDLIATGTTAPVC